MNPRSITLSLLTCALAFGQRTPVPSGPRGNGGVVPPTAGDAVVDRPIGGAFGGSSMREPGEMGFHRSTGPQGRELRMPPRPAGAPQVTKLSYFKNAQYGGRRILFPPGYPRLTDVPDVAFWGRRDIMAEIQWLSRAGFLPVTPVDPKAETVVDYTWMPSGWKAYGFAVPPGGKLQVEVKHTKLGWFRLMAVDHWGKPGPGMLQAAIAYRPILVTITNPKLKADEAYIIVDDPGWWSTKEDPYTLVIRRDWDPDKVDLSSVKLVSGLWGASPSVTAEFRRPSFTGPAVFPH